MSTTNEHLQIFVSHRSALIESVLPIVGCRSRAEDVVQEAFIRFAEFAARDQVQHPVAFLFRTVRNLALDRLRRLSIEQRHGADEEVDESISFSRVDLPEPL